MKRLPVAGVYTICIATDRRINRDKRTAQIAVRYGSFLIKRPANLNGLAYPADITVQGIWAYEITEGVAEKDLINWKLLTTHKIRHVQDAQTMIEWYNARWYI